MQYQISLSSAISPGHTCTCTGTLYMYSFDNDRKGDWSP